MPIEKGLRRAYMKRNRNARLSTSVARICSARRRTRHLAHQQLIRKKSNPVFPTRTRTTAEEADVGKPRASPRARLVSPSLAVAQQQRAHRPIARTGIIVSRGELTRIMGPWPVLRARNSIIRGGCGGNALQTHLKTSLVHGRCERRSDLRPGRGPADFFLENRKSHRGLLDAVDEVDVY